MPGEWAADETGMAAGDSFATEAKMKGGTIDSLIVTNVIGDGPIAKHFGIATGDEITAVNGMAIGGLASDEELARALVTEAYGKKQTLSVRRGGQTLTLPTSAAPPQAPAVAADPANPNSAPTPAPAPGPTPRKSRGIAGQIEDIQNAAGGGGNNQD